MESTLAISSYIDIAPNEYVTKYSLNRNFEKLISNDIALISAISQDPNLDNDIETYNSTKTYAYGTFVFYKIHPNDTQFYILRSICEPNDHKPLVHKDPTTGIMYVINSEWWTIVGIDSAIKNATPKDIANVNVMSSKNDFKQNHELNLELSAHPTGELGFKTSTYLYKSFDNIDENRKQIFYPYAIESFVSDNTTYHGYMRKWDNGLLEYDLTFRLGYVSSDNTGIDLIQANDLKIPQRNNNSIYFKNPSDMNMFNQGGQYYVAVNGMKQMNLNRYINAYSGKIKFIEPFKDLNYMVFTSNVKNIETEAFNIKIDAIQDYDDRLVIDGLNIVDIDRDASYKTKIQIPVEVKNIKSYALANVSPSDGYAPQIEMLSNATLMNIEPYAFSMSDIRTINIPASTCYIGKYAFSNCGMHSSVCIYSYTDPKKQVIIDDYAFIDTNVSELSIIYVDDLLSTSYDEEQISSTLPKRFAQIGFGEQTSAFIYDKNGDLINDPITMKSLRTSMFNSYINKLESNYRMAMKSSLIQDDVITVNVNDLLSRLNENDIASKNIKLKSKRSNLFAAPQNPSPESIIKVNDNGAIIGFNSIGLTSDISIDLNDIPNATSISDNALYDFYQLTALAIPNKITSLGENFIDSVACNLILSNVTCDVILPQANVICAIYDQSTICKISCQNINDLYLRKDSISNEITANSINNLFLVEPSLIGENGLTKISSINQCNIYSPSNSILTCQPNIFVLSQENNTTIDYSGNVGNVRLYGSYYDIQQSAFSFIRSDYLSLDMENSRISSDAFIKSNVNIFEFCNTTDPAKMQQDALKRANAYSIKFPQLRSLDEYGIISSENDNNRLKIPQMVQIELSNDNVWYYDSTISNYLNVPSYLNIDGNELVGIVESEFLNSLSSGLSAGMIIIPSIVNKIAEYALDVSTFNAELSDKINVIYVPNSITSIGDYAFAQNSMLYSLTFEPGIKLKHIGIGILSNCVSLQGIALNASL